MSQFWHSEMYDLLKNNIKVNQNINRLLQYHPKMTIVILLIFNKNISLLWTPEEEEKSGTMKNNCRICYKKCQNEPNIIGCYKFIDESTISSGKWLSKVVI